MLLLSEVWTALQNLASSPLLFCSARPPLSQAPGDGTPPRPPTTISCASVPVLPRAVFPHSLSLPKTVSSLEAWCKHEFSGAFSGQKLLPSLPLGEQFPWGQLPPARRGVPCKWYASFLTGLQCQDCSRCVVNPGQTRLTQNQIQGT